MTPKEDDDLLAKAKRQREKIGTLYTAETTEQIAAKIKTLFGKRPCPMCGGKPRVVMQDGDGRPYVAFIDMRSQPTVQQGPLASVALMDIFAPLATIDTNSMQAILVMVCCAKCGMTTLHNPSILGLLDLTDEPADGKKPSR